MTQHRLFFVKLVGLFAVSAFAVTGCGGSNNTADSGTTPTPDLTMTAPPPDMAVTPPDMAVTPPDMVPQKYSATMLFEEATVTVPYTTDAGTQSISGKVLVPIVSVGLAGAKSTHDYDDTNAFHLGCFSDHYDLVNGKKPGKDSNAGTVVMTGYSTTYKTLGGATVPDEIDCVIGASGAYQCGFGMAMNGMVGPDPATAIFPPNATLIPPGKAIRFKYAGGMLGTYDSMNAATATETLAVTEDLTTIKYDATKDTTIHFTCPDDPMMAGKCPTGAVLVTLVASSKNIGEQGYPGTDFGSINCVAIASANQIVIKQMAIEKMYGGSNAIKQVYTRVVRGSLPPGGQMDDKGNGVTLAVGRGVTGFAPR